MERRGKIAPTARPNFNPNWSSVRFNEFAQLTAFGKAVTPSVTRPTSCGPMDAPKSPPAAIKAKRNTPPWAILDELTTRLPGHIIALQSPVNAQAISPIIGRGEKIQIK